MYVHRPKRVRPHTDTHTDTYSHTHTHKHARTYIYVHTHTHTDTFTHMCVEAMLLCNAHQILGVVGLCALQVSANVCARERVRKVKTEDSIRTRQGGRYTETKHQALARLLSVLLLLVIRVDHWLHQLHQPAITSVHAHQHVEQACGRVVSVVPRLSARKKAQTHTPFTPPGCA